MRRKAAITEDKLNDFLSEIVSSVPDASPEEEEAKGKEPRKRGCEPVCLRAARIRLARSLGQTCERLWARRAAKAAAADDGSEKQKRPRKAGCALAAPTARLGADRLSEPRLCRLCIRLGSDALHRLPLSRRRRHAAAAGQRRKGARKQRLRRRER